MSLSHRLLSVFADRFHLVVPSPVVPEDLTPVVPSLVVLEGLKPVLPSPVVPEDLTPAAPRLVVLEN